MSQAWEDDYWFPLPGFDGYEVSDTGQVRSLDRLSHRGHKIRGRILKQKVWRQHLQVKLYRDGTQHTRFVHSLVLEAFVGPRPDGGECRHLNGDPMDNRLENLTWGTKIENAQDTRRHGTHHHTRKTACPKCGGLYSIDSRGRRYCKPCLAAYKRLWKQQEADMRLAHEDDYCPPLEDDSWLWVDADEVKFP